MSLPRSLYALLVKPREFFETHPPRDSFGGALLAVLAVSLVTTLGVAAIGWTLAANVDATYTETVAEPWPESACEGFERMNVSSTPAACALDEPKTRQVDVGSRLWDEFLDRLPLVFAAGVLGWLFVGAGLHFASWVAGGEGSFARTLSVAGWGMLPGAFSVVVGVTAAVLTIRGTEFGSDPAVIADQFRRLTNAAFGPWGTVASVAVTAWQVHVWIPGLERARNLDRDEAVFVAGAVGVVTAVLSLVG